MIYTEKSIELRAYKLDSFPIRNPLPEWLKEATYDETMYSKDDHIRLVTDKGNLGIHIRSYIIEDEKGKISACRPDIFETTYRPIESSEKI